MTEAINKIIDLLNDADTHMKDEIRSAHGYRGWVRYLLCSRQHLQEAITDALKALKDKES